MLHAKYYFRSMGRMHAVDAITESGSCESDDVFYKSAGRIVLVGSMDGYDFHSDRYGKKFHLPGSGKLYVNSEGRLVRVWRLFPAAPEGDEDANRFLAEHAGMSVLGERDGITLVAHHHDDGIPIPE